MKIINNIFRFSLLAFTLILISNSLVYSQVDNKVYVIEQGDTVYSIASRYGISIDDIYDLNPWAKSVLRVGGKLLLPSKAKLQSVKMSTYIIKAGDTMYSVCKHFGISEEQLVAANPDISPDRFPAGRGINIPPKSFVSTGHNTILNNHSDTTSRDVVDVLDENAVKITLALPFMDGQKYLEFYKGFLMGVNDEKQKGISIDLDIVDLSSSSDMNMAKSKGYFSNRDVVIGGVSQDDILEINNVLNSGYFVVPFNGSSDISQISSRIVQLNSPDASTQKSAVSVFLNKYKSKNIYFAHRYDDESSVFAKSLQIALTNEGVKYYDINLDSTEPISIKPNSIIVPVDKKQDLLLSLLSQLPQDDSYSIFGYPLWQSFSNDILDRLHYYNTTIFTTFYFDNRETKSIVFLNKFKDWYRHPISNSFPNFGVMGYDIAHYFIDNVANQKQGSRVFGGDKDTDESLQMGFSISKGSVGMVNTNLYFVTFAKDGSVYKSKVM